VQGQTNGFSELTSLAKKAGIYLGVFLAGGAIAFVYSYSPIHKAKNWKIHYLEERLESKDIELQELQRELSAVREDSADKPDGQTFKLLQDELVTTDKTVKDLERKLSKAERRVKELAKSRDSWKAKHASAQSRPEVRVAGSETASEGASAPPAAPAPHAAMAEDTATEPAGQ